MALEILWLTCIHKTQVVQLHFRTYRSTINVHVHQIQIQLKFLSNYLSHEHCYTTYRLIRYYVPTNGYNSVTVQSLTTASMNVQSRVISVKHTDVLEVCTALIINAIFPIISEGCHGNLQHCLKAFRCRIYLGPEKINLCFNALGI
jgi:hypothetical protein